MAPSPPLPIDLQFEWEPPAQVQAPPLVVNQGMEPQGLVGMALQAWLEKESSLPEWDLDFLDHLVNFLNLQHNNSSIILNSLSSSR